LDKPIIHINIVGRRASGQSTVCGALVEKHNGLRIRRVTDRLARQGELDDYMHVERRRLLQMINRSEIILETVRNKVEGGFAYLTAVPVLDLWPPFNKGMKRVRFSMFGTSSLLMKEMYCPDMINVYLFVHSSVRRERLDEKERRTGVSFDRDRKDLLDNASEKEREDNEELMRVLKTYDHVVINDGSIEECVKKIELLCGL
jgi:guanylate kinase